MYVARTTKRKDMQLSFPDFASEGQFIGYGWSVASQLLARHEVWRLSFRTVVIVLGLLPVDGEPAGILVHYKFFLLFALYLIRIWLFSIMVLVIVEGQGQNSNWWVKAWSLSRWFTIKNSSSTLVLVVA